MKTLPELIIDDFDAEQVWAGVTLQNKTKFEKLAQQIEILSRYSSKTQGKDTFTNHVPIVLNNFATKCKIKVMCFPNIFGKEKASTVNIRLSITCFHSDAMVYHTLVSCMCT